MRENVKALVREYNKTEDDLKALQVRCSLHAFWSQHTIGMNILLTNVVACLLYRAWARSSAKCCVSWTTTASS